MRVFCTALFALCGLVSGCGRDENGAPFKFEGPRIIRQDEPPSSPPPRPIVRLLEPANHQRIGPEDKKIICRVELIVPNGGKMPQGVTIELQNKGINYDTCDARPDEDKGGGRYILKGQLNRPKRPGTYTLRALVDDSEVIKPKSDDEAAEIKPILTYSPSIEIEVVR